MKERVDIMLQPAQFLPSIYKLTDMFSMLAAQPIGFSYMYVRCLEK
jgi:hypothetical protein